MSKALVVWGGWDGHTPREAAEVISNALQIKGFEVRSENSLELLADLESLKQLDLIVPVWTMGQMTGEQTKGLSEAVKSGVGFGGFHGGAGDAFRGNLDYEWMVGGLFVGHPHVGTYTVKLTEKRSPITAGLKKSFVYESEQYYMMTDPGNTVLATTSYKHNGTTTRMPVIWTKKWGNGRVFYSALGHVAAEFVKYPAVLEMTISGMLWAAAGKGK